MTLHEKVARMMCDGPDKPACGQCLAGADEILGVVFDHLAEPSEVMVYAGADACRYAVPDSIVEDIIRAVIAAARAAASSQPSTNGDLP